MFPNRLQHFEYDSISVDCEALGGSPAWAVKRKSSSGNATCGANWGLLKGSSCLVRDVYVDDSGEYWCETKDGTTSKSINIAVTGRFTVSFITVFPYLAATEEGNLSCCNRQSLHMPRDEDQ